jgi:hypothetical protein
MIIIGCDYHPGFQQIAFVDTETGDYGEQRLEHTEGAEKFYPDLAAQGRKVRVGMEASGARHRFMLDANCISELVRNRPEPRYWIGWKPRNESVLYLSVLTLGEIRRGVAGLPQGKRRTHWRVGWNWNCKPAFRGEFCPSTRRSPTVGKCSPQEQNVLQDLCRPWTVCWLRPLFTMA